MNIKQRFKTLFNGVSPATKKSRPITLNLSDKHEPFGTLSIDKIKSILEEEDFEQLQSLFFYMMRDLKIASSVLARRMPIEGLSFTLKSENEDFVQWVNDSVDTEELIGHLSTAIYYGISLSEVRYDIVDLKRKPTFHQISPRFIHAEKGTVLKKTIEHLYIKEAGDKKRFINKLDPDSIVFHKHAIDIGEITDFSLASKLVWYFSLKHIAIAHNVQYFDNIATPPLIAKTDGDEDDIIESLYQLKSASVGVFGKEDIIEYLKVDSKADFLKFIEYIDRQIATVSLGNSLSTGEGKNGSRSQSEVHENRQKEVLKFDAKKIAKTATAFFNRLEQQNYANHKGCVFAFDLKEKKDLLELSKVIKNLSDSGFELDQEDLETQFGLKIVGKKQTEQDQQNNTQQPCPNCHGHHTSHNALNLAEDYLDEQKPSTKAAEKELLNFIETTLKGATNYQQAYEQLLAAYEDVPTDKLDNALFKAIANSQILADAEVQDEQ